MQAKDIVTLACRMAKTPGMVVMGGQFLNLVLQDLWQHRDLKVNRVTQLITVAAAAYGPFALEADYSSTYDLFYQIPSSGGATASSITQFLVPVTMEQFDAEFKSPSISNYPYEFATDLSGQAQVWSGGSTGLGTCTSQGQMFIYPQSSGQLILTHRYMKRQDDITTPEMSTQTPWFEYDEYLIYMVASHMAGISGDDRQQQWRNDCEKMLLPHMIMQGDEMETVQQMRLDPRHFHFNKGLKPTKASPY